MNKVATFFYVFKNSFKPKYYKDVLKASFGFSLKYYFFYFFIFGLVSSVFLSYKYFVPFSKNLARLPNYIASSYPSDLILEVKDGNLVSNFEQPLIISMDIIKDFTKGLDEKFNNYNFEKFSNFLIIDTKAQVADFNSYKTMILVTSNNIISYGENNSYQVNSLGKSNDFILDKNFINENIDVLVSIIKYLPTFFGLAVFWIMVSIVPIGLMVYLVFYSVIMMFISSLNNKKIEFKKSFQIGMHLETLWITIISLITLIEWRFRVPFMQTLFMVFYSVMILKEISVNNELRIKNQEKK